MKHTLIALACMLSAYSTGLIHTQANQYRLDHNRPALIENEWTCSVATARAQEIETDWSHDGFWKYSVPGSGENLGRDFTSERGMVDAWIASPTHNENLLRYYKFGCVRCVNESCAHIFQY